MANELDWTDLDPEVRRLYQAGTTWDRIEELLGVSVKALRRRVKNMGLPPRGKDWAKRK